MHLATPNAWHFQRYSDNTGNTPRSAAFSKMYKIANVPFRPGLCHMQHADPMHLAFAHVARCERFRIPHTVVFLLERTFRYVTETIKIHANNPKSILAWSICRVTPGIGVSGPVTIAAETINRRLKNLSSQV